MASNETTLYFVKVSENFDGKLREAFESAKSKDVDVQLVSGRELLEQGVDEDRIVFVMNEFTGDVFELLLVHKKKILGPICILQCIEKKLPLPLNGSHAVYSMAMSGVVVSCTNVEKSLRNKLKQHIQWMNGVFVKDFTTEVTHIVAGEVGSAKYAMAAHLHIPILLTSWAEEAWQRTQTQYLFDAKDEKFVDENRCPVLKGCAVCVTGLDFRRREEIQRLVEEHGGIYCGDLKLKVTTHLLVEKPIGQKYKFALRWSIHCVHPNWLVECVKLGCWVEETPYLVAPLEDANVTSGSTRQLGITTVNGTMNSTTSGGDITRKAELAAKQSATNYESKDILDESRQSSLARVQASGLKSLHKSKHASNKNSLCNYNVPIPSGDLFLDGCQVYLTGFNDLQLDYLQKIINAGGGTRFSEINSSVSHIVVGDKPLQDIERLVNSEFSPHVVTVKWLLESCRQVKCLPEQDYKCFESNDVFEGARKSSKENNNKMKEPEKTDNNGSHEILKQYLDLIANDDRPSATEGDEEKSEMVEKTIPTNDGNQESVDGSKDNDMEDGALFHGQKFRIDGFTEEQVTQLQTDIDNYGGIILTNQSKTMADFLVVPMNYEGSESEAKTMVTYCWLEQCVESGKILEPTENFLFSPFSMPEDVFPLQDCVISVSQYENAQREHMIHLIEVLGGHYQEFFSRIARTNLRANTHLILEKPEGNKYKAARGWNIPAVSADWLYECARTGHKVQEARYMVTTEKDKQEQLGNNDGEVFKEFTVPASRGTKEVLMKSDQLKAPLGNQKTKDKNIASSSNTQAQPIPMNLSLGIPQRPMFDLTDALEFLKSPCASSGSSSAHSRLSRGSRNSFLMDDFIQEHLQAAVKNTGNVLVSRKDGEDHEGSTVDNGVNNEEKGDVSSESTFLRGVVLAVSKKCAKQLPDIHNMTKSVGAEYRESLDKTCTHLIHEGRLTKEHNQAKSRGVHVVSRHWFYDCIEQQGHLDESLYPSTYNPKLAVSVVKKRKTTRSGNTITDDVNADMPEIKSEKIDKSSQESRNADETSKEPGGEAAVEKTETEITMDELQASEVEALAAFSQSSTQSDSLRAREEIKHIKDLMQTLETFRRSSRLRSSGNSGNSRNSSGYSAESKVQRRTSSRLRSLRSSKDVSEEEDDGQAMGEITYDDPKSRLERERIIAQLEDSSPNPNTDDETIDANQMGRSTRNCSAADDVAHQRRTIKRESCSPTSPLHSSTPTAPPIALHIASKSNLPEPISLLDPTDEVEEPDSLEARPTFSFSAMTQQEKIDYSALIENLGGVVFDNQFFTPASRHTIAGKLNRNEKCLSSIAAGNWLLRKSYLEACRRAGCFVDQEPHEWGVEIPEETMTSLAVASRRWRIELNKKSARYKKKFGAFQDWKVLLCVEESKVASFERMLEAGGAKVIGDTPPFQNIADVTHAFISPGAARVKNIDFDRLEQAGVLVLKTDYIVAYLTENSPPATSKYVFRSNSTQPSKKRKQCDSGFPEAPGKKKKES